MPIALEEGIGEEHEESDEKLKNLLLDSYGSVHEAFRENLPDADYSGSTCLVILLNGHKIYSANCGDSRAILVNK